MIKNIFKLFQKSFRKWLTYISKCYIIYLVRKTRTNQIHRRGSHQAAFIENNDAFPLSVSFLSLPVVVFQAHEKSCACFFIYGKFLLTWNDCSTTMLNVISNTPYKKGTIMNDWTLERKQSWKPKETFQYMKTMYAQAAFTHWITVRAKCIHLGS